MTDRILIAAAGASVLALAGNTHGQTAAYTQGTHSLMRRFDVAIRSIVHDVQAEPRRDQGAGRYFQRWTSVNDTISVRHSVFSTAKAAKQTLEGMATILSVPTTNLDGFGDRAILVAPVGGNGQQHLKFARGRVLVEIAAPGGEGNVRRVAARLLEEVNAAIKSGELEGR